MDEILSNEELLELTCSHVSSTAMLETFPDVDAAIEIACDLARLVSVDGAALGIGAEITEVAPADYIDFLDLLPPTAIGEDLFLRLWQYGHLVERAERRFWYRKMGPVATDRLEQHTNSLVRILLVSLVVVVHALTHLLVL